MNGEVRYYSGGGVEITNRRAVFGQKTHAMCHICSVSVGKKGANRKGPLMVVLGGLIALAMSGAADSAILVVTSIGIIGLGIALAFRASGDYVVHLRNSSGETETLITSERGHASGVADAVSRAFAETV